MRNKSQLSCLHFLILTGLRAADDRNFLVFLECESHVNYCYYIFMVFFGCFFVTLQCKLPSIYQVAINIFTWFSNEEIKPV